MEVITNNLVTHEGDRPEFGTSLISIAFLFGLKESGFGSTAPWTVIRAALRGGTYPMDGPLVKLDFAAKESFMETRSNPPI